jgi:DNA replication protein
MKPFAGFPAGKVRLTPVPDLFFAELLTAINDLAELKVTLYMFWFLYRQSGQPRYMTWAELASEGVLLSALRDPLGDEVQDPIPTLRRALERAVERGSLLQISIADEEGEAIYFFLNSAQGREAVAQVKAGELLLERRGRVREAHVQRARPNIFELYEDNIALLQPLIAEELIEAADTYPEQWIEDAFRIAVERNVRHWRYVRSILERWAREGKDSGPSENAPRGRR